MKSSAMTALPFPVLEDATDHMNRYKNGEFNWVELQLGIRGEKEECIQFVSATVIGSAEDLTRPLISNSDARCISCILIYSFRRIFLIYFLLRIVFWFRFFLCRPPIAGGASVFVFSCPEATAIRRKMTMSSSKVNFLPINETAIPCRNCYVFVFVFIYTFDTATYCNT